MGSPAEGLGEFGEVGGVVFLGHDDLVAVEAEEGGDGGGGEEFGEGEGHGGDPAVVADDGAGDGFVELGPGELVGAGEGVDFADGAAIFERVGEGAGDVFYVDGLELAGVFAAEVGHEEEGRGGFAGPFGFHLHELAGGAVDKGGAENGPFEAACAEVFFGAVLGFVIVADGIEAGAEGGHLEEAFDVVAAGGVDDVFGCLVVDPFEGLAARGALHDDADEVNDGVAALHGVVEGGGIEEIAVDGMDVVAAGGDVAVIDEGVDFDGSIDEFVDDGGTDKTAAAGDEDAKRHGEKLRVMTGIGKLWENIWGIWASKQ